jgi:hypothetical protein
MQIINVFLEIGEASVHISYRDAKAKLAQILTDKSDAQRFAWRFPTVPELCLFAFLDSGLEPGAYWALDDSNTSSTISVVDIGRSKHPSPRGIDRCNLCNFVPVRSILH